MCSRCLIAYSCPSPQEHSGAGGSHHQRSAGASTMRLPATAIPGNHLTHLLLYSDPVLVSYSVSSGVVLCLTWCRTLTHLVSYSVSLLMSYSLTWCRTLTLSWYRTLTLSWCRTLTLSWCRTLTLSWCRTLTLSWCRTLSPGVVL